MIKAGRWLRVSTSGQDEASQEPDVDRWCQARGYEVVETYRVHGYSAYKGEHEPDLRRMLADMKAGKIEVLVVWKSDRLERRGAYALMGLIAEAIQAGGRLEFVTEPALNNASDPIAGPMLQAFYGAMAHHESKVKSDRTSLGGAQRRAAGSFFAGDIPYGYDSVALDDRRVTLKPNDAAPVVARIFEEVASGKTLDQVARDLTADGIPTARGKTVWSEAALSTIVRNPIHRGHVRYKGTTYMTVEPTTTAANWLAANTGLDARAKTRGRDGGRKPKSLLSPVCGQCGGPMYRYAKSMRCAGVGPSGNAAQRKGCGNTIPMALLDAEVWAEFAQDDEPYIVETVVPGRDWSEEIAAVQLTLRDLDQLADDYDDRHDALRAELRRLRALPVEPERRTSVRVPNKTEGDAFKEMTPEEQGAEVRRFKLTVWPKGADHQEALVAAINGRRWTLTWKS